MFKEYEVVEENILNEFLLSQDLKRKELKKLLTSEKIKVNDKITTKYNYALKVGDVVSINKNKSDLRVLFEDKKIIIVDKPYNLLCIGTETSNNSLYWKVSEYVKHKNKNNKVFIVNRLDKETSGIVVFAKNQKTKEKMQANWEKVERKYIAIVEGKTKKEGRIESFLSEDKNLYVKSSYKGKKAITLYKRIKESRMYTWLEIEIKTGRKNQIRVHMKDINCVIKGDVKYGSKKEKRMFLHANSIKFFHPSTNKLIEIKSTLPRNFEL